MCNPLLVGIAAAAGGQYLQAEQADDNRNRQIRAQTRAMEATRESQALIRRLAEQRQEAMRSQSADSVRRALAQATRQNVEQDMSQARTERVEQDVPAMQSGGNGGDVGSLTAILSKRGDTPRLVSDTLKAGDAAADAEAQAMAERDARMRAFGDAFRGLTQDINRTGTTVGTLNNFRRGSSAVLPFELGQNVRRVKMPTLDTSPLPGMVSAIGGGLATGAGLTGNTWGGLSGAMFGDGGGLGPALGSPMTKYSIYGQIPKLQVR